MAIGINDLDDDDIFESQLNDDLTTTIETSQLDDDFISDFLKTRGIEDSSKIKFEDENNQIIERDWKDLTKQEKFNIMNTPLEIPEDYSNDLTDEEIYLLNQIRQSNMTPSEYLNQLSGGEIIQEPQYNIDLLSDDEVYILDLESRVGELTDEQAAQALNIAKQQDEELYKKQIEGIRKEYKEREDFKNQQDLAQIELEQQEAYNVYRNSIIESIDNLNSIGNLDLNFDDNDKNYLAEFMLEQDETGKNYLYEALQDPETLTKAAWFILNGEEAFNSITEYFKNEIKLVSLNLYRKGLEDGLKGIQSRPLVVITKPNNHREYKTINDLDDDD